MLKSCISLREAYLRNLMEAVDEGTRPGPEVHLSNILTAKTKLTVRYLRPQLAAIRKATVSIVLSIKRVMGRSVALQHDEDYARPVLVAQKYLVKICEDLLVLSLQATKNY